MLIRSKKLSLWIIISFVVDGCEDDDSAVSPMPDQPWIYNGLGGVSINELEVQNGWDYAAKQQGLFRQSVRSSDTSSWSNAGMDGEEITDFAILGDEQLIAIIPLDNENSSNTLYMSSDGENNRSSISSNFGGEQTTFTCQALNYNQVDTDVLDGRGYYNIAKSTDGGEKWTRVFFQNKPDRILAGMEGQVIYTDNDDVFIYNL